MRIKSPVGEYDYRVTAVRLERGPRLEIDGSLGQWQTTMVVEPRDLAQLARRAGPIAGALALLTALALRRL